jgi:hypothetical protein
MAYGGDVTVYVEDKAGDQGFNPAIGGPWWLSPDVDIPAHTGEARQGANQVQIRVHTHEEPILSEKIKAEVYVGIPSLAMSPVVGTKRIDPGLTFRPPGVAGTEPVADLAGGTATFDWTPSNTSTDVDGPGHRCLVVRAFPESVTPPTDPFNVVMEPHEAQHNIEVIKTAMLKADMSHGGAGTEHDPRRRDSATDMWWERLATLAAGKPGRRYVVWAFDPDPSHEVVLGIRHQLGKFAGFSKEPPAKLSVRFGRKIGDEIDPTDLLHDGQFVEQSGLGHHIWSKDRLLAGVAGDLEPDSLAHVLLLFDHSNLAPGTAVVLHGAQWDEHGKPEGGMTVVALAPV